MQIFSMKYWNNSLLQYLLVIQGKKMCVEANFSNKSYAAYCSSSKVFEKVSVLLRAINNRICDWVQMFR